MRCKSRWSPAFSLSGKGGFSVSEQISSQRNVRLQMGHTDLVNSGLRNCQGHVNLFDHKYHRRKRTSEMHRFFSDRKDRQFGTVISGSILT